MPHSKKNKKHPKLNAKNHYRKISLFFLHAYRISKSINKRYLFFVLISSSIWVFSKLSKEYNAIITFNFNIENTPDSGLIVKESIYPVELLVKGTGFSLLSHNLFSSNIPIDFKSQVIQEREKFFIKPKQHLRHLRNFLRQNRLALIESPTKLIMLDISPSQTKNVPIIADIKINYTEGFDIVDGITIDPPIVTLSGTREDLNHISSIRTTPIRLDEVSESFTIDNDLVNPFPEHIIKFNKSSVSIRGKVTKFTQKVLSVPIEVLNIPQNIQLSFFPETVEVSFNLPLEQYDDVSSKDFKIVCFYNKLDKKDNFMIPKIIKKPNFIKGLDIHNKRIEFLIKQ